MVHKKSSTLLILFLVFSFTLFPVETYGMPSAQDGGGGGGDCCVDGPPSCCEWASCTFDEIGCIGGCIRECSTKICSSEYCPDDPGGGPPDDDRDPGWKCKPMGPSGQCVHVSDGGYSSKEECEEHCPFGTYNVCRKSNWSWLTGNQTEYCKRATWENTPKANECTSDAQCSGGSDEPTKYACSGAPNYACSASANGSYDSLADCQDECKADTTYYSGYKCSSTGSCSKSSEYCRTCQYSNTWTSTSGLYSSQASCESNCQYKCQCANGKCSCSKCPSSGNCVKECSTNSDCPGSTPDSSTPPESEGICMIDRFELPERAWVGYPLTGEWSASDWCDDCDVSCEPYPDCVWSAEGIGIGLDEFQFTLSNPGDYTYTLKCYGQGEDEATAEATVQALHLPWWREIIPVLPGFLRGLWD